MFKKVFFLLCILLFATGTKGALSGNDDEAYILGLRYPRSYDVGTYQDKEHGILSVRYKVHLSFPSKEVLNFYNDKLNEIGWVPFVESYYNYADRVWENLIDSGAEGDPLVHQLLAKWANKDKSRMFVLFIRYYSTYSNEKDKLCAKGPNNNIQDVILQFMPFYVLPPPRPGK